MLQVLLFALAFAAQDPQTAPKTVEDRLKELDEKISALEKKHKQLSDENAGMEKKLAEAKAAREQMARQMASGWVQQYAKPVQFTDSQRSTLEQLWFDWTKEDLEKRIDVAAWKLREEAIRKELTPAQVSQFARKVREDQEAGVKRTVSFFIRGAKLDAEKTAAFEKAVVAKIGFEEGALLLQAHPEKVTPWTAVPDAAEAVLPQFASTFTESETKALRQAVEQWRPRQR
jgi:hypothetical protein